MKKILKLFNIHSSIGKIILATCIAFIIFGLPATIYSYINPNEETVNQNYFIGDSVPLHDGNYDLVVNQATTISHVTIMKKNGDFEEMKGNFIIANISISMNETSELKIHKIGRGNFILKDHTGLYLPLHDILGAVGWDAIDIHIDNKEGGHLRNSTRFSTIHAMKDYNYYNKSILYEEMILDIVFKAPEGLNVENNLAVLEVDFYIGASNHKKGSDIVLLPRPTNIENE